MSKDNKIEESQPVNSIFAELTELRWRVLPLIMTITFGSYYIYDFPGCVGSGKGATIEQLFTTHGKEYTYTMNQALYSVYNYPNMILALFGGVLIDRIFGIRKATMLFTSLIFFGSVLFWIGVTYINFPVMVCGRVLFGLGGESLSVAQSAYTARWFAKSPALAVAFGICLSFSRVGSSFNFLFMPKFASAWSIETAVLTGVFACAISLAACLLLVYIDARAERDGLVEAQQASDDAFHVRQLVTFPLTMWLIVFVCFTFYMAVFPFTGIAKPFFEAKYNVGDDTASDYVSMNQFVSAGASPLLGFTVDRVGRGVFWMIFSSLMLCGTHVLFIIESISPWAMMSIFGVAYSILASSLWPAVPYVVPQRSCGTAYGLMTAIQNFGSGTMPLIVGTILDSRTPAGTYAPTPGPSYSVHPHPHNVSVHPTHHSVMSFMDTPTPTPTKNTPLPDLSGFYLAITIFIACTAASAFFATWMWLADLRDTGMLSASPQRRKELEAERGPLVNAAA